MREYERIETPTDFPAMCLCGSQKAPLVDTHLVKDAYGHVYLCRLCITRSARALGIDQGRRARAARARRRRADAGREGDRRAAGDRSTGPTTIAGQRGGEARGACRPYIEQLHAGEIAFAQAARWTRWSRTARNRAATYGAWPRVEAATTEEDDGDEAGRGLSDGGRLAEKFDLIDGVRRRGIDLQTKAEREQAEQDAADAEEQRKEEEEKAAEEADETADEEPEAKTTPAKTAASTRRAGRASELPHRPLAAARARPGEARHARAALAA